MSYRTKLNYKNIELAFMNYLKRNFLEYIKPLSWKETFGFWRENEASRTNWIKAYKNRGFNSWDDWRQTYAKQLGCEKLRWNLYKLVDPAEHIPSFYGGPYRTWVERFYGGKRICKFSEIIKLAEIQDHKEVNSIANNFPKETVIIGLVVKKEIVIIEGMHRCCAIALMSKNKKEIKSNVFIALAEHPKNNLPVIGRVVKD